MPETWNQVLVFLEDAAKDANENTTAPGEAARDWWAGHERGLRDTIEDLKGLRDGSWKTTAGYAGVEEEEEPAAIEVRDNKKPRNKDEEEEE